jgi:endonuclease/exonuclease/phosphatase (EEP) superfamily protein YafD
MEIALLVQKILCGLLVIAVILPFVKNDYWVFRILEYPRNQKFFIACVILTSLFFTSTFKGFDIVLLGVVGACVIYLAYKIWPYTPLAKTEMLSLKTEVGYVAHQVKILSANVFQDNKNYDSILQQIKETDADLVFLVETNKEWEKHMDKLIVTHPHCLKEPLENTYGLLFYSRFEIVDGSVKYLVDDDVPSIEAFVVLPVGKKIKVWGLHPKPPVPGEDSHSTAKDKELMKVALKAKMCKEPVVVMGDLNDVAWSYVTELFRKTSELLDPRRGRGFFSTFSANHWYMRFPLDYIFCSSHFGLIKMKRLKHNGSDHFPMFIHLEYKESLKNIQEKPKADAKEKQEAAEKATEAV